MRYLLLFCTLLIFFPLATQAQPGDLEKIYRLDPKLDRVVPLGSQVEKVAGGFKFSEGPVWVKSGGYLLFSDIPNNVIHKWHPTEGLTIFIQKSGYTGSEERGGEKGSNGLTLDAQQNLIVCQHGDRTLASMDLAKEKPTKILADSYMGKKFNSPNDAVVAKDGSIFFTDPPYGLINGVESPDKELSFQGVYHLKNGILTLIDSTFSRPNGIALSPDEETLYVANSGPNRDDIYWARFKKKNGEFGKKQMFFDGKELDGKGNPDGMKVDIEGNLYCTGPDGVVIFDAKGKHLGTISFPEVATNCAFGGEDGKTLFVTAQSGLYKIKLGVEGVIP